MQTSTQPVADITLYFREGNSDKVYQASIVEEEEGFTVHYAYGRRGSTLKTGTKTQQPVSREKAEAIYQKLVSTKQAKGYQPGEDGTPYRQTALQDQDTGIRCQLLNPIAESEVHDYLLNSTHCLQEKLDGRRLLVRKVGDEIIGINRRGLVVSLPDTILKDISLIREDLLLDGEALGDTYHAFDLLEAAGANLRSLRYIERHSHLIQIVPTCLKHVQWVSTMLDPADKFEVFNELREDGKEGVVLKDINAPYSSGRPNSGGSQLKYKFYETASCLVTGHNAKRSINIGLLKPAGNVTIPPNHSIPPIGCIVEIRYLYAFPESGSLYQPIYLGERKDIPGKDCHIRQLKFKPSPAAGK